MSTVSIIMPFKNASEWIGETIQSIQVQTYSDWELLAINDFSTDNSLDIVKDLANRDTRIKFATNREKGIIPALQLGLNQASGTYITRMDADDIMPDNRLKRMVEELEKLPENYLVTGLVNYFSEQAVSEGYKKYEHWLNQRTRNNDHFDHLYRECVVASPNWLVRKKALDDHQLFDDLTYPEDYDMTFRWYTSGIKVSGINEVTLLWREHPMRTSRNSEVYDQHSFFQLKTEWFLRLNNTNEQTIGIIGAGKKGKLVASILEQHHINFKIYAIDHDKYQNIYDVRTLSDDVALICVYPENRSELERFLSEKEYTIGKNAWYF